MKFKNKQDYLNQRDSAMVLANGLKDEGKIEEATAKLEEVEAMDNAWAEQEAAEAKELANQRAFEDRFNGLNMSNIQNKSQNRKGVEGEKMEPVNVLTNEQVYVNAWAKDMMGKRLSEEEQEAYNMINAYTHDTGNTGVVIPETVTKGIWQEIGETFPLWNDVNKTYAKGTLTMIKADTTTDAKWYDEATSTEDGTETFGTMTLTGCELSRAITISWKLKEMAIEEFIPYIQSKLAERIGAALGYGVAVGKGKPGDTDQFKAEPKGIVTALKAEATTPQVVTYTGTPDYAKMVELMSKVKGGYLKGAAFYADNATIWTVLANIQDASKRPYFVADSTSGGVGRIFGILVKEDDSIPTGEVLLGNALRGYHANVNKTVTLDSEDHKKERTTDYIAYAIVDGDVVTTKAFALLKK